MSAEFLGEFMPSTFADLPRRRLLGCGLASLAFGRAAWGQSQDQTPGQNQTSFQQLPAQIKVTPNHLTIDVRVNEHGPFRFVVDTGADTSVIAEDVAEALHLPLGKPVVVQGIIRAVPAQSIPIAQMSFGSIVRDNLQVPVLPRSMLQADGYLGLDAIGPNRVLFDFQKKTLQILSPRPATFLIRRGTNESTIDAPGDRGHLRAVACRVDGVSTMAFIDSGAEVSAGNLALQRELLNNSSAYVGSRDIELTGITGGSSKGRVINVETILLGDLEFSGCEIAVADLDVFRIWGLVDRPALLIGLNFLREFQTVSVDYTRKEFRLKLAASAFVNRAY